MHHRAKCAILVIQIFTRLQETFQPQTFPMLLQLPNDVFETFAFQHSFQSIHRQSNTMIRDSILREIVRPHLVGAIHSLDLRPSSLATILGLLRQLQIE